MIKFKRVLISSLLGLGFGLVSILIGYGYGGFKSGEIWATVLNRAVIGFVIGISGLKIFYPLHGLLIGLLVGLPYACWWLDKGGGPFLVLFLLGGLWGLLIEILTTRVFRSPARK